MEEVVLTRSPAKDRELIRRLAAFGVPHTSVPLVEHTPGPGYDALVASLTETWAWVLVTSPTAARFLAAAWERAGRPRLRVAALGGGTARVLEQVGLVPEFVSPEAYGRALAASLPATGPVLWPTSDRAGHEVGRILEGRGVAVQRLDVYTTRPRKLSPDEQERLERARVVALASPSAVEAWVHATSRRPAVAAIGRTTGETALAAGFAPVLWPERPGVDLWAEAIRNLYAKAGHLP